MPQDYAYQNEAPNPNGRTMKPLVKLGLVVLIIIVLCLIARYLYVNVDFAQLEEKAIATLPSHRPATTLKKQAVQKPRFEFYTMLPNGDTTKLHPLKTPPSTNTQPQNLSLEKKTDTVIQALPKLIQATSPEAQIKKEPTKAVKVASAPIKTVSTHTTKPTPLDKTINGKKVLSKDKLSIAKSDKTKQAAGQFLLQVGSFRTYADAHKLKGRLLLEGFTVKISSFTNEAITWYRVQVGPYHSLAQAQKAQDSLEDANLNCLLKRIA